MGSFGVNCKIEKVGYLKGDFCYCFFWLNIFYLVNVVRVILYNWENLKLLVLRDVIKKVIIE